MKALWQILQDLNNILDVTDKTNLQAVIGAALVAIGNYLQSTAVNTLMGAAADEDANDGREAVTQASLVIEKLGGQVPMMSAEMGSGGILITLLPILLKLLADKLG